jgi:hypothetical protein
VGEGRRIGRVDPYIVLSMGLKAERFLLTEEAEEEGEKENGRLSTPSEDE